MLPADRYLAELLAAETGIPAEDCLGFLASLDGKARLEPAEAEKPQAGISLLAAVAYTALSIGFSVLASFLKPRQKQTGPPEVKSTAIDGQNVTTTQRFAPRFGFDSVQSPAGLQSVIPLVYARRRSESSSADPLRPAAAYGGIRINMPLLWSQLWTVSGGQLLRSMLLLGEGAMEDLDEFGFALGDNSLGAYDLGDTSASRRSARLTIYASLDGSRIVNDDRIAGRLAQHDLGNAVRYGGSDVFRAQSLSGRWRPDFCATFRPTSQTRFGLYGACPNNLGVRVNPRMRPTMNFRLTSRENGSRYVADNEDDAQALAEFWRSKYTWSGRSGIISTDTHPTENQTVTYRLDKSTDAKTIIAFDESNTDAVDVEAEITMGDVASTVTGRQQNADDSLIVGELYKCGTAWMVLEDRTPGRFAFVSDSENDPVGNGQSVEFTFRVVREGYLTTTTQRQLKPRQTGRRIIPPQVNRGSDFGAVETGFEDFGCGTNRAHVFRCAMANVILPRSARVFELGFKSTLGIEINGLCNFRSCPTLGKVNSDAGDRYSGQSFDSDDTPSTTTYTSGTVRSSEDRYSFFRIYVKKEYGEFVAIRCTFGMKGSGSAILYNYLRMEMSTLDRWEIRIEPISGWELRNGYTESPWIILDAKSEKQQTSTQRTEDNTYGAVTIWWNGYEIDDLRPNIFRLNSVEPENDLGYGFTDDDSMIDRWAKASEIFVYEEVQSSAQSEPEHEIAYVNVITQNDDVPNYDNLAIVGVNIHAAQEWQQFSQLSAYVLGGIKVSRLIENDFGASNLFPDILRDLLLNRRYGTGFLISARQVDDASFLAAAQFCLERRYFYDGAITEQTNLRQWASDVAATMLLELIQRDGKFTLEPALVFDGPVPIRGLFNAGNIIPKSFELEVLDANDRAPIQASVKYREERQRSNLTSRGFFAVEKEVLVREADRPSTDPIEKFDLSDYCTSFEHAVDFAAFVIRVRRYVDHTVKFKVLPSGIMARLAPGDYIKVAMDYTYYDEVANGAVLANGRVTTTRPDIFTDGTWPVIAWDGSDTDPVDTTITIVNGECTTTGILFALRTILRRSRTYKIDQLSIDENAVISIEASHHPTDTAGFSELRANWPTYKTDAFWTIEGPYN
jgi:hypothetical protein